MDTLAGAIRIFLPATVVRLPSAAFKQDQTFVEDRCNSGSCPQQLFCWNGGMKQSGIIDSSQHEGGDCTVSVFANDVERLVKNWRWTGTLTGKQYLPITSSCVSSPMSRNNAEDP